MKNVLLGLFLILFLIPAVSFADKDADFESYTSFDNDFSHVWNVFYYHYKLRGYPAYIASLNRYDFYDINNAYCGSLRHNPLSDKWEYFKL